MQVGATFRAVAFLPSTSSGVLGLLERMPACGHVYTDTHRPFLQRQSRTQLKPSQNKRYHYPLPSSLHSSLPPPPPTATHNHPPHISSPPSLPPPRSPATHTHHQTLWTTLVAHFVLVMTRSFRWAGDMESHVERVTGACLASQTATALFGRTRGGGEAAALRSSETEGVPQGQRSWIWTSSRDCGWVC